MRGGKKNKQSVFLFDVPLQTLLPFGGDPVIDVTAVLLIAVPANCWVYSINNHNKIGSLMCYSARQQSRMFIK